MVVETVFGTLLVIFAVVIGVGGPLMAIHFQQRYVHERNLAAKIDEQQGVVVDFATTVDKYRKVTQLEPEDIGAPIAAETVEGIKNDSVSV
jgi:hypothetical protein